MNTVKNKPTAMDLFSGCGGLTLGLKKAGFNVIGSIEIDPLSVATYKANHPEVTVWENDIRKISSLSIKRKLGLKKGNLDLLAGCPPCQGFSTMRTLNGALNIDDPINDLVFEFLRFVEDFLPCTVMMENVPGLAKDSRFTVFMDQMEKLGYIGEFRILNASNFGVPQRRRRLIYLAGLGFKIPYAKQMRKQKTVRDVIGELPKAGESGDLLHDIQERRSNRILNRIKKIPKDGGSRTDLPLSEQLKCHKKCNGFKDVYGRMAWDRLAPTITSGCFNPSKGRFLHPEDNRAITMREAALLQGFPIKYKFPIVNSKSAIAFMIGNALPPPFIASHAILIKKTIMNHVIRKQRKGC